MEIILMRGPMITIWPSHSWWEWSQFWWQDQLWQYDPIGQWWLYDPASSPVRWQRLSVCHRFWRRFAQKGDSYFDTSIYLTSANKRKSKRTEMCLWIVNSGGFGWKYDKDANDYYHCILCPFYCWWWSEQLEEYWTNLYANITFLRYRQIKWQ